MRSDEGYGGARPDVWRAYWRDRIAGNTARANARMGYLRPPQGRGKVLWIKAGRSRESVRLGAELLGAIRRKRLDIRIALTFEHDYSEILEPRVRGLRNIGLGYGPSDLPSVVRRTLRRLDPLGIVLADAYCSPNLQVAAADSGAHIVAFNTDPASVSLEAAYPSDEYQAARWSSSGLAGYLAPAADPLSLFVEAQADATLKTLVTGGGDIELWWWLGGRAERSAFVDAWKRSELAASGVLFVSALEPDREMPQRSRIDLAISTWRREALGPGTIVEVDDERWGPAVSSAVKAVHCAGLDRTHLWECLTGGPALTASQTVLDEFPRLKACAVASGGPEQTLTRWLELRAEPIRVRHLGDCCRRLFWEERRRVQAVLGELLQRIFDW